MAPKTMKGKDHCTYFCGDREWNENKQKLSVSFLADDISSLMTKDLTRLLSRSCFPTRIHQEKPSFSSYRELLGETRASPQAQRCN